MIFQRIYICGPNQFNNRLIAGKIKEICTVMPDCVSEDSELNRLMIDKDCLVFCDCFAKDAKVYCTMLARSGGMSGVGPAIVFMNVRGDGKDLIPELKKYNIRGIFYVDDDFEKLTKGVQLVVQGECWLRRNLLALALSSSRESVAAKYVLEEDVLTKREIEIVRLIVSGFSNRDIADKLFISTNTVKTHVSNLYKKIDVTNRVQAILWASENLSPSAPQGDLNTN